MSKKQNTSHKFNQQNRDIFFKPVENPQLPHQEGLPNHIIDNAALNFHNGNFSGVIDSLTSDQNLSDLQKDLQGLALVSLSYLALDNHHHAALRSLDQALDLLKQHRAKIEINRSVVLGYLKRYEDGIKSLRLAQDLAPELWSIPLGEIALLEKRQAPQDRQRVKQIGQALIASYPEWQTNGIGYYLAFDGDYSRLREDPDFFAQTFGILPKTLCEILKQENPLIS